MLSVVSSYGRIPPAVGCGQHTVGGGQHDDPRRLIPARICWGSRSAAVPTKPRLVKNFRRLSDIGSSSCRGVMVFNALLYYLNSSERQESPGNLSNLFISPDLRLLPEISAGNFRGHWMGDSVSRKRPDDRVAKKHLAVLNEKSRHATRGRFGFDGRNFAQHEPILVFDLFCRNRADALAVEEST